MPGSEKGASGDSTGAINPTDQFRKDSFTNAIAVRARFGDLLKASSLPERILVVYGVSGVGKSTLMRMLRLDAKQAGVRVALATGDDDRSAEDILRSWVRELHGEISLPRFSRELKEHQRLAQRVRTQAEKVDRKRELLIKGVGAMGAGVPFAGPFISFLVSELGPEAADWLLRALGSQQDVNFLLNPAQRFTDAFLSDLKTPPGHDGTPPGFRHTVLLLDTYERLRTLDQWVATLARDLSPDVLLVVAGQEQPRAWSAAWPGWQTATRIEKLDLMTDDNIRELVHRYYAATRRGEPEPAQVDAIVSFARGLPIVAAAVADHWIRYPDQVEDFEAVKKQVVANLGDYICKGQPQGTRQAFTAAGTLRWFNKELLQELCDAGVETDSVFEELRTSPLTQVVTNGWKLHDSIRKVLDEDLYNQEPERHRKLHEAAAAYCHRRAECEGTEESSAAAREELYHQVMAREDVGMRRVLEIADELVRYQLVSQLSDLITDLATYPLRRSVHLLWRDYYQGRLADLQGNFAEATRLYQAVANTKDKDAPTKLRAYALVDWAWITRSDPRTMEGILNRLQTVLPTVDDSDPKLGYKLFAMAELRHDHCDEMLRYLEQAREFYQHIGDRYWLPFALNRLKYYYLDRGRWRRAAELQDEGLNALQQVPSERERTYLRAELLGGESVAWMCAGQYHTTEKWLHEAMGLAEVFGRVQQEIYFSRDLGLVLGLQGKVDEAQHELTRGLEKGRLLDPPYETLTDAFKAVVKLKCLGSRDAEPSLSACVDAHRQLRGNDKWMLAILVWNGILHEQLGALVLSEQSRHYDLAEQSYRDCLDLRALELWYWHACALVGLVRVYQARKDTGKLATALQEADDVLREHPFADHLASLRLSQAFLAWEGTRPDGDNGFDAALRLYQEALVYASCYNRFLLDDVLMGGTDKTPLRAIVPHCRERGEEGAHMLARLADWWNSEQIGTLKPEPETIAPIPTNSALIDWERQIRQRESGDGNRQPSVAQQIQDTLRSM